MRRRLRIIKGKERVPKDRNERLQALLSEDKKHLLGSLLSADLQRTLERNSTSAIMRQLMPVDPLPPGAIPIVEGPRTVEEAIASPTPIGLPPSGGRSMITHMGRVTTAPGAYSHIDFEAAFTPDLIQEQMASIGLERRTEKENDEDT